MIRSRFFIYIALVFWATTVAVGFAQGQGKATAEANGAEQKQDIFKTL